MIKNQIKLFLVGAALVCFSCQVVAAPILEQTQEKKLDATPTIVTSIDKLSQCMKNNCRDVDCSALRHCAITHCMTDFLNALDKQCN